MAGSNTIGPWRGAATRWPEPRLPSRPAERSIAERERWFSMSRMLLDENEIRDIRALLAESVSRYGSAEDSAFVRAAQLMAHELPRRLRAFLNDFRLYEPGAAMCTVSRYPIDQQRIGPPPAHWKC